MRTLLDDIEDFLTRTGMTWQTFGRLAVKDWKFVRRLREGGDVMGRTEQRVRHWMTSYEQTAAQESACPV